MRICPSAPAAKVQISAFVTVQEGCDKFCTFCVVPYTRGAEFSRTPLEIVAEVRAAGGKRNARDHAARAERQCLSRRPVPTAAHGRSPSCCGGSPRCRRIERLRFTTSHPLDMDDELIALFGDEPKLMPYLHLPFQSGSDRILKAMNRQAHGRRVRGGDRQGARGAARHRAVHRHYCGLSRARPTPISIRPWRWPPAPASPRPSPLSIARGRERQRQASNDQVPEAGEARAALRLAKPDRRRPPRVRPGHGRAATWTCCSRDAGGNQVRSPGVHLIYRRCMWRDPRR